MRVRLMEMSSLSRKSSVFTQIASLAQEETTSPGCSEGNAEMIMNCASEKGRGTVRAAVAAECIGSLSANQPRCEQGRIGVMMSAARHGSANSAPRPRRDGRCVHTMPSHVMLGEMSVVGPRPHPIALNEAFAERISPLSRRHKVKPGITGWAQVHGHRGETDTIEKMGRRIESDLYYIDNWSFLLDIKIIVMTLFSRRAYTNAV